jgi:hypothetical protein
LGRKGENQGVGLVGFAEHFVDGDLFHICHQWIVVNIVQVRVVIAVQLDLLKICMGKGEGK